jgi:uncharacterized protein DUF4118
LKEDSALAAGYVAAGFGTLGVAAVLSPVRGQPLGTGVVILALGSVIVVAAALAGPVTGAMATVTAAMSYDFLFVPPYRALTIASIDELWPAVLLIAFGAAVAVVVARPWRHRHRDAAPPTASEPNPSQHVQRIALLIAQGAVAADLVAAVQAELTGLLLARSCRFESGRDDGGGIPRIERDGRVSSGDAGPALPPTELELPVRIGRHHVGHFVIEPTPGADVPMDRRIVAVILTDHLAAALASGRHAAPPRI